jgi:large subunit ribosomal protein L9
MRVILNETYEKLGKKGDVLVVKDGFARNFLFPKDIAVLANANNLKRVSIWKEKQTKLEEEKIKEIKKIKEKLDRTIITIKAKVKNDQGELFGSIGASEINAELKKQKIKIEKSSIDLKEPFKKLGKYQVPLKLPYNLTSSIQVVLEKE